MNLLNKLTIKTLKLNKKRTIVTIIGIVLSISLITAVSSMYFSAVSSMTSFIKQRDGNYHIVFYQVEKDDFETFENNNKVDQIYYSQNIGYAKIDSKNEDKPYAFVKAYDQDSLENLSVNLVDGRFPNNDSEIIIPTHLKTNGRVDLKVGDEITLDVGQRHFNDETQDQLSPYYGDETIVDTTSKTYKVVGIMGRPPYEIEDYMLPGYTFITFYEQVNQNYADVYVRVDASELDNIYQITGDLLNVDGDVLETFYDSVYEEEDYNKLTKTIEEAPYHFEINQSLVKMETSPLENAGIAGLGAIAILVCIIIIGTSVFCIKNSFDISITEKIKQYGMLRSIGATKKQIRKNVFYESFLLGGIGIPLGILAGLFASYILMILTNHYLNNQLEGFILRFDFSIMAIIVSVVLGMLTIYLSAIRSAFKASRISPMSAIKNQEVIKIKRYKRNRLIHKVFHIGGDIAYKNVKRNKRKYRTTIISIIVSVAVFIGFSSLVDLAWQSMTHTYKMREYNPNYGIYQENFDPVLYDAIVKTTKLDNINDCSLVKTIGAYITNPKYNKEYTDFNGDFISLNGSLGIYSVNDLQYKKYLDQLGLDYNSVKDKAILIDDEENMYYDDNTDSYISKRLRAFTYEKGDVITVTLDDEETSENHKKNYDFTIAQVSNKRPFGLNYGYSIILLISDELYDELNFETWYYDVYFDAGDPDKLQDQIDIILADYSYHLDNIAEELRNTQNFYTLVEIFLYGFIIVISLIGITNIFNAITTNMELRKQEFAMLQSIGMSKKEFNRLIHLESIFMGTKALLFGIPLGIGLSYLVYLILNKESFMSYPIPIFAIVISIIVVMVLIFVIMRYSIGKISKQNIIETIRNENI